MNKTMAPDNSSDSFHSTGPLLKKNVPLSERTTIRTGGNTAYLAQVSHTQQLLTVISFAREHGLPFYVLGKGSNVVIDDRYFHGIVITLKGDFCSIRISEDETVVTAGAGSSLAHLAGTLAAGRFKGFEFLAGIPGTVGGGIRINAGTGNEQEMKNIFLQAEILNPMQNRILNYSLNDMMFGYRTSALSCSSDIILEATFILKERYDAPESAYDYIRALQNQRNRKTPQSTHTFGSVFKNPAQNNLSAGRLLEQVGMKGLRRGDAMVSEKHANWIINTGSARSADIKKLIAIGQKRVLERFGFHLEREVVFLPEDMEKWD